MTAKSLAVQTAQRVNRAYSVLNEGTKLEDNGYRIRASIAAARRGKDVVEIGSSYFYRSQANTSAAFDIVTYYAKKFDEEISFEAITEVRYDDANWPKTSWATVLVRIIPQKEQQELCPKG